MAWRRCRNRIDRCHGNIVAADHADTDAYSGARIVGQGCADVAAVVVIHHGISARGFANGFHRAATLDGRLGNHADVDAITGNGADDGAGCSGGGAAVALTHLRAEQTAGCAADHRACH